MKNNVIAIDAGSVNTVIYKLGSGVVLLEPSVVAVAAGDNRRIKAIGGEAKKLIGKTADATQIIFPIFEANIENEVVATDMMENFLNKITLKRLGLRPKAILAVPCGLENDQIK